MRKIPIFSSLKKFRFLLFFGYWPKNSRISTASGYPIIENMNFIMSYTRFTILIYIPLSLLILHWISDDWGIIEEVLSIDTSFLDCQVQLPGHVFCRSRKTFFIKTWHELWHELIKAGHLWAYWLNIILMPKCLLNM